MSSKKRHWSFILYPESAPEDWLDTLECLCIPCAVSPLHDSDFDKSGQLKKPHYHIILSYPGPTTFNNVCVVTRSLHQPIPIPVLSIKASYEYLFHKNCPDKHLYNEADIKFLSGFRPVFGACGDDGINDIKRVLNFISDNSILEFGDLVSSLICCGYDDLFACVVSKSYFFTQYLRSLYFTSSSVELKHINDGLISDFPVERMEDYDGC